MNWFPLTHSHIITHIVVSIRTATNITIKDLLNTATNIVQRFITSSPIFNLKYMPLDTFLNSWPYDHNTIFTNELKTKTNFYLFKLSLVKSYLFIFKKLLRAKVCKVNNHPIICIKHGWIKPKIDLLNCGSNSLPPQTRTHTDTHPYFVKLSEQSQYQFACLDKIRVPQLQQGGFYCRGFRGV